MTVYLIHLDTPFKHAKHYVGFTTSPDTLDARIEHHRAGRGATFLRAVASAGITFDVVRTWPEGSRTLERRIKARAATPCCPVCNPDGAHARFAQTERVI